MADRTLSEIIDAAKVGEPTTHEECLYALLAYAALHYFDNHALQAIATKDSKFITPMSRYEDSFRRFKAALGKPPKDWVGWNNDPQNPEHVKFVQMGRKVIDLVVKDLEGQDG